MKEGGKGSINTTGHPVLTSDASIEPPIHELNLFSIVDEFCTILIRTLYKCPKFLIKTHKICTYRWCFS